MNNRQGLVDAADLLGQLLFEKFFVGRRILPVVYEQRLLTIG